MAFPEDRILFRLRNHRWKNILEEAATEIERLRLEVKTYVEESDKWRRRYMELCAKGNPHDNQA